jgi:hypothetical protein
MLEFRTTARRPRAQLLLEALEDRTLLSVSVVQFPEGNLTGDQPPVPSNSSALPPAGSVNTWSPYNLAPAGTQFDPIGVDPNPGKGPGGGGLDASDPGSMGPLATTTQEYDFGNAAYMPPDFASLSGTKTVELTASIHAPTTLTGTYPVVLLMHGNHFSTYAGSSAFYEWPPAAGHTSLPNYRGYDYFADILASNGYVVISIGVNGVNVIGNQRPGTGMLARGQLGLRHLDILTDLNRDGIVHNVLGRPDGMIPGIGTRYVGHLDLQNVGVMGHSRGGEGAVQTYLVNQSTGSHYGIKAVFALAPVDFLSETINNVPFAVLLPYNDGDVSDLQGVHFFDDSRYNVGGDTGAKYTIEVMGADHNFYNTVWAPGGGYPGESDDGNPGPPSRLTQVQQRGTGLAYMSAFFRLYLHNDTQFKPFLTGDSAPPPSAQVTADRVHFGYLTPGSGARRDINQLTAASNLTTNSLGGAVTTGSLATYTFTTGGPAGSSEPHRNLGQVTIGYTGTLAAFWDNALPAGLRDERLYNDLQFRVGVNYGDARNPANTAQDFSVRLTDGNGASFSVHVSSYSNDLFDPPTPSINPHEVLNTVRIPLSAFVGHIDLGNVTNVRFLFDQHNSGAFQITDLDFGDPASASPVSVQMSPTLNNIIIRNNPGIPADVQVVNGTTSAIVAEYALSGVTNIAVNCDSSTDTLTVDYHYGIPVPSGGINYQFGPGVDTLNVNDTFATTGQTFTLNSTSVQRSGSAPITFVGGINFVNVNAGNLNNTFTINNTEVGWTTTVNTGTGSDLVNVLGLTTTLNVNCQGGGGTDVVNVGNAGSLSAIAGTLNLENEPSFNTVNINDQNDAAAHTAVIDTVTRSGDTPLGRLQGIGSAVITWDSLDTTAVNINFGSGTATVNVLATVVTTNLFNNALATVNVGNANSIAGIVGTLNLENEPSFDTVNINDQTDAAAHTAVIDTVTRVMETSLGRLTGITAAITWDYFDTSAVNINFGSGTTTVNVLGTGVTTNLFNNGGATVNVGNANSIAGIVGPLNLENEPSFDTVNINDQADAVASTAVIDTVTRPGDTSLGRLTGIAAAITWDYFDTTAVNINFGSGGVTTTVLGTGVPTTLNGNAAGNNALIGPNAATIWNVTGPNAGNFSAPGAAASFTNYQNLTGGSGGNTFVFSDGVTLSGALNGGSGGPNTLDSSAYTTSEFFIINGANAGFGIPVPGGFSNIQTLIGGGGGSNSFGFYDGGSLSGTLNGGTGPSNTLDYSSNWTGNVTVDLQIGATSGVNGLAAGSVSNILNVLGASGGGTSFYNLLVGNGGNYLQGGTGRRNILVAGGAASTLVGGDNEDLLIAGSTAYDTEATLGDWQAIAAYWTGSDDFGTRVGNLLSGSGVPILDPTSNVFGNGGGNTLTGNGALALIFSDGLDTISGFDPGSPQPVPINP